MPRDKREVLADLAFEAREDLKVRRIVDIPYSLRQELGITLTDEQKERATKMIGSFSSRQQDLLTELSDHLEIG